MGKKKEVEEKSDDKLLDEIDNSLLVNPLLNALRANDKENMFKTESISYFHKTGFPLIDYYFGSVINVHDVDGSILRQEPMIGQAAGTFNMILGGTQNGKALPVNTMIPVPSGWKRFGDLKIGDKIFDEKGGLTEIEGIYPQGKKEVWELIFAHGKKARCCEDHLWTYKYSSLGIYNSERTASTHDMREHMLHGLKVGPDSSTPYKKFKIINPKAVSYDHQSIPIHPYVLGAFIGNGCCREKYLTISSQTEEIPNMIAKICKFTIKKYSNANFSYSFCDTNGKLVRTDEFFENIPSIIKAYSRDKKIPDNYLYNSKFNRWELLRGLMDSDGCVSVTEDDKFINIALMYSSTSKELLENMRTLIHSLGMQCTINEDKRIEKYNSGYCGTLRLICDYNDILDKIFSVSYKRDKLFNAITSRKYRDKRNRVFDREHVIVEDIIKTNDIEEMMCIKVTNPTGLFLTEDFIVTHNTTLAVQIAANIIRQYENATVHHYDCENRTSISRIENITGLPIHEFDIGGRYILKSNGVITLDALQNAIIEIYTNKIRMKDKITFQTGRMNEFNREISILEPTIIIIDSIATVLNDTFSVNNNREIDKAKELRSNTEGARNAKSIRGFLADIIPLCKEANIIIYAINHITGNMSMGYGGPSKQQNFLKQEEAIPGGKALAYSCFNEFKLIAKPGENFTEDTDGFAGHIVMIEPIKSSSNQSGNESKGVSFEMVFSHKDGFDSLRSLIWYAKNKGILEGNRNRYKFKEDQSFSFSFKGIYEEANNKPIWENVKKYVIPELETHLSYVEPNRIKFDPRQLDY